METLPRQKYTKEFREQAVRLVREQELPIPEAARRLSMSGQTLSNWVFKARHGQLVRLNGHRKPVTDLEAEVSRLTRELAEAREGGALRVGVSRQTIKTQTQQRFMRRSRPDVVDVGPRYQARRRDRFQPA